MEYNFFEKILIENSLAGFFITSLKGELIDCNQSFVEIFGYNNKEDILKVKASDFYYDMSYRDIYVEKLSNDGFVKNLDINGKKQNGKSFYFRINSNLYTDENNTSYIIGSVSDVTLEIKAHEKIKEEENKIENFLNNSVQIIQSFDKNGKILFANDAWKNLLGYDNNDLKSITLFDIISDDYKNHCSIIFNEVLNGTPVFDLEAEFISKKGEKVLLKGNALPLMKDGELIATHAFFNEIGALDKVTKKLKEQEAILQTIFDNTPVCLYLKDENGKYIFSNKIMQDTLGCEVTGKTDQEIFGEDGCDALKKADKIAILEEEKLTVFNFTSDISGIKKHFYCGKKAVRSLNNSKLIFGYSADVTDLTNKTLKIEENEKILNLILSNSSVGLVLFSLDSEKNKYYLEYSNDFLKNVIAISEDKKDLSDIFGFIEPNFMNQVFNSGNELLIYEWNCQINDQLKFYKITFSKININNNVYKLLVLVDDITEKNILIKDLEHNLNENKVLLGEVHHRVKNNLAIIDGIVEMNKFKMANSLDKGYLSDIQLRIKSIALVHEKLYKSASLSSIPLTEYIPELCHHYKRIHETSSRNKINFSLRLQDNCNIDVNKSVSIGLLMIELISNSLKHATIENSVSIDINLEKSNETFTFKYSDSGKGFAEGVTINSSKGFGFRFIKSIIIRLKAEHQVITEGNFNFIMKFNN